MLRICIFISSLIITRAQNQMESFIVGGTITPINKYPHSAFLSVSCNTEQNYTVHWVCGASIVNQQILLTAGHCVFPCVSRGTRVSVNLGNEHRYKGIMRSASGFVLHEKYDPESNNADIAIVKLSKPVKFTSKIRRVAIMKRPPYYERAYLAGWGDTNEYSKAQGYELSEVDQKVWKRAACHKLLTFMPRGAICATSPTTPYRYAASGDSGSALIVRDYIQIGLVSYKVPGVAVNLVVYTDVGYHYDWVQFNSHRLHCASG